MGRLGFGCALVAAAGLAVAVATISLGDGNTRAAKRQTALKKSYSNLPLSFEPNRGQARADTRFVVHGRGYTALLRDHELALALSRRGAHTTVRMGLVGASPRSRLRGARRLPGTVNYLQGHEPRRWRTNIPTYASVVEERVYPGVDLLYRGKQDRLEYTFLLRPAADPDRIALDFRGAMAVRLGRSGSLVLELTGGGRLVEPAPFAYQTVAGRRRPVGAGFSLRGGRVGFALSDYDPGLPLVIDPTFGGSGDDIGSGIAVDSAGSPYLTGWTDSTDWPTANPYQGANAGFLDAFVMKLSPDGSSIVYSTYLGGDGDDLGNGIAVGSTGAAYVTGFTGSTNFPIANAYQENLRGIYDGFVTKLSPDGSTLVYSTYLGGSPLGSPLPTGGDDRARAIAVDSSGSAYVTGQTNSKDFPTVNAYQSVRMGPPDDNAAYDVFVTKLSPGGSALVYSTYLGGNGGDFGFGIAADSAGSAYVTGWTGSTDFPIANAYQSAFGGPSDGLDAFVTKFDPGGSALVYSTYLGGTGSDNGWGIAADSTGAAYVAGQTGSTDFPTVNPFQAARRGGSDAFVTKLNPSGSARYSTYLGGNRGERGFGIAVDAAGAAWVTGDTESTDFPTANPLQAANAGFFDAFVTKLSVGGNLLLFSTYRGGSDYDTNTGIALGAAHAWTVGYTESSGLAPADSVQHTSDAGFGVFVSEFPAVPTAVGLRSLAAARLGRRVVLRWRTASEVGLLGFNVYRGRANRFERVNARLIPSAGLLAGRSYSFRDRPPTGVRAPRYWLELVRTDGSRQRYGPAAPRS
jgi:hypothetical protein